MKVRKLMKDLINFNREGMSLDEFKETFYRKLRLNTLAHNKGEFDSLLEALYSKDDASYKEYIEAMKMMYYGFVRRNTSLMTKYISEYSAQELDLAYKMIQYQDHVIERNMININILHAKNYRRDVLEQTKKILEDIKQDNDDSILRKAQKDFKERFENEPKNEELKSLYNELFIGLRAKIELKLKEQLAKVDGVEKNYYEIQHLEHKVNAIRATKKHR